MTPGEYRADLDLFLATQADGLPRLRVYRPEVVQVVLGRGSQPESELHLDACQDDGVDVVRRSGGGCAVVLDPGQAIVAWSMPAPGFGENLRWFARISEQLIDALEAMGLTGIHQAGISDLARGERKVAGACLHRARDALLYSASLLIDPEVALMERYLRHPPREPDYRRGRRHADFVGRLASRGSGLDAAQVVERLESGLRADFFS